MAVRCADFFGRWMTVRWMIGRMNAVQIRCFAPVSVASRRDSAAINGEHI